MKQKSIIKKTVLSCFFLLLFLLPIKAKGVTMYVDPLVSRYRIDDVFLVEIRGSVDDTCFNAVKVELLFPPEIFEVKYFSEGGSVLRLWPRPAKINNEEGMVSFVGGVPSGYCGDGRDVLFGRLAFQVKDVQAVTERDIRILESSRVLLDDGMATPVALSRIEGSFTILPERSDMPLNLWEEMIREDKTPPEDFLPEIRDYSFEGEEKKSVFFQSHDEETGIDYYEISEQRRVGFIPIERESWRRVESPVTLQDQSLRSIIKIRAVDMAGNERVKVIHPSPNWQDFLPWLLLGIFLGGFFLVKAKKIKIERGKV